MRATMACGRLMSMNPCHQAVLVNRHPQPPIPAVWTGNTGESVKAELRRRHAIVQGHASPNRFKFTGLIVCALCGCRMSAEAETPTLTYWVCPTRHPRRGPVCPNRRQLRDDVAQVQIDDFLKRLIDSDTWDIGTLSSHAGEGAQKQTRLETLKVDIDNIRAQTATLISRQSQAPLNVQELYAAQIEQASKRLAILEEDLRRELTEAESPSAVRDRELAYQDLLAMGRESLWTSSPGEINQLLHRLIGKLRFVAMSGEIVDVR